MKVFGFVCFVAVLALALGDDASKVVELTGDNFKEKTSEGFWLVEFFAPWCGHCKKLTPTWEHLANELDGKYNIAKVDCTQHRPTCTDLGVSGFPTIKLLENGEEKQKYQGPRTATGFTKFLQENGGLSADVVVKDLATETREAPKAAAEPEGPSDVVVLGEDFAEKTKDGLWFIKFYAPWCGHCKSLAPTWANLATQLKGKAKIGKVDCTVHKSACSQFSVKGYPTLKLLKDGAEFQAYSGARSIPAFEKFLKEHEAIPADLTLAPMPDAPKKAAAEKPKAEAVDEGPSDVITLGADFEEKVKEGTFFVKFYAPWCGHCKKLVPAWSHLASELKGKANIAKVDCTVHKEACSKFGVRGYPTLKLLKDGEEFQAYSGGRSVPAFEKFLKEHDVISADTTVKDLAGDKAAEKAPAKEAEPEGPTNVIVLGDADFEEKTKEGNWLVKFYAPWCGHCKRLVPTWEELATLVNKGPDASYRVAKVDCTKHSSVCSGQGVKGYPTLKLLKAGDEPKSYRGGRDLDALKDFLVEDGLNLSAPEKKGHEEL